MITRVNDWLLPTEAASGAIGDGFKGSEVFSAIEDRGNVWTGA